MIVSNPVKVMVEIEDLNTRCTYVYKGNNVEDCKQYFKSLFFGSRPYRILYTKPCNG